MFGMKLSAEHISQANIGNAEYYNIYIEILTHGYISHISNITSVWLVFGLYNKSD